jgi:hypothetical protein
LNRSKLRGFSAKFARHKKEHENYVIHWGSNRKSSGCSWTWPAAALLVGFPAIPSTGDCGERGKIKRTTKGFDFRAYRRLGHTKAAGIEAGRDYGGLCHGSKLGGDGRRGMRAGAEVRLQGATAHRAGHFWWRRALGRRTQAAGAERRAHGGWCKQGSARKGGGAGSWVSAVLCKRVAVLGRVTRGHRDNAGRWRREQQGDGEAWAPGGEVRRGCAAGAMGEGCAGGKCEAEGGDDSLCSALGGGAAREAGDAGSRGSWWRPRAGDAEGGHVGVRASRAGGSTTAAKVRRGLALRFIGARRKGHGAG